MIKNFGSRKNRGENRYFQRKSKNCVCVEAHQTLRASQIFFAEFADVAFFLLCRMCFYAFFLWKQVGLSITWTVWHVLTNAVPWKTVAGHHRVGRLEARKEGPAGGSSAPKIVKVRKVVRMPDHVCVMDNLMETPHLLQVGRRRPACDGLVSAQPFSRLPFFFASELDTPWRAKQPADFGNHSHSPSSLGLRFGLRHAVFLFALEWD